jgi:heparin/heparan-sulfate lyase
VIAFETGPHYTYAAGDATPVHRPEKCSQVVRQFVFLPPHHFIIFDRVVSTEPAYQKRWLLHHANEPVFEGNTWRSDQDEGRIYCRTLLPKDAVIQRVGGPGKEFIADGVNYAIDAGPSQARIDNKYSVSKLEYKEVPELMGRWRVEVSPGADRTDDIFLHLVQVGDHTLQRMVDATVQRSEGSAGVDFTYGGKTLSISFNTEGDIGGSIRIDTAKQTIVDRPLTLEVMPQEGIAGIE